MARDLIRLMQSLFLPALAERRPEGWCPAMDVYRTDEGWLLKFDLAGVRLEDIRIEVCGNLLTVSGCRRDTSSLCRWRHYQMEIAYSEFRRTVELPATLTPDGIATEYRDGMLLISIRTETEA